ncbi:MAG: adenylate/guanylate cyclase domain-containing protein [Pseudomonadota bacterium]
MTSLQLQITTKARTFFLGAAMFAGIGSILGVLADKATIEEMVDGMLTGAMIGCSIMAFEIFILPARPMRFVRRLGVSGHFLLRLAAWSFVIVGIVASIGPPTDDPEWRLSVTISFLLSLVAVTFMTVERLIGHETFLNLLSGRYHQPRQDTVIFLLIDLKGTTAIAERIGDRRFFEMVDRFISDTSEPIRAFGGDIYKFVGDEIIAYWHVNQTARPPHCLACWRAIRTKLNTLRDDYLSDFGVYPEIHGALHAGPVMIGQVGDYRREIAMIGDPLNTASRLLELTRGHQHELILSEAALAMVNDDRETIKPMGSVTLRGREGAIAVSGLPS